MSFQKMINATRQIRLIYRKWACKMERKTQNMPHILSCRSFFAITAILLLFFVVSFHSSIKFNAQ